MRKYKLYKFILGFTLLIILLGAKPQETMNFNQLYPLERDSIGYSNSVILKFHKTYCFPENKFVSIVDLVDRKNAIIYFEVKDTLKPITSYLLNLSIDLTDGEPRFFANSSSEKCLSWMIYKTSTETILAKLNRNLPQKGDKGYSQSKYLEYVIVKSEIPDIFNLNYNLNRIQIGESSPFGCYFLEHNMDSSSVETIWFCKGMIESKGKIILKK